MALPLNHMSEWFPLLSVFLLVALGYALAAALTGLLGSTGQKIGWRTRGILLTGLCAVLVITYVGRRTVFTLPALLPVAYMALILAHHTEVLRRRWDTCLSLPKVAAGFVVALMMAMGSVMVGGVIDPWGWNSISSRELPGVILFGLAGFGMILLGFAYLLLGKVSMIPRPGAR